jgi:hypothetical protein
MVGGAVARSSGRAISVGKISQKFFQKNFGFWTGEPPKSIASKNSRGALDVPRGRHDNARQRDLHSARAELHDAHPRREGLNLRKLREVGKVFSRENGPN